MQRTAKMRKAKAFPHFLTSRSSGLIKLKRQYLYPINLSILYPYDPDHTVFRIIKILEQIFLSQCVCKAGNRVTVSGYKKTLCLAFHYRFDQFVRLSGIVSLDRFLSFVGEGPGGVAGALEICRIECTRFILPEHFYEPFGPLFSFRRKFWVSACRIGFFSVPDENYRFFLRKN